ncbi:MAG TPA: hypothetical protein VFE24_09515 [Pirellulales bacterium]|nr:hypothetical protein [Pirellulales bacterium]
MLSLAAPVRAKEPAPSAAPAAEQSSARERGSLTGRIVVDCDDLRAARLRALTKDPDEVLCGRNMQSESFAVNPRDDGLANVFVYLRASPEQPAPPRAGPAPAAASPAVLGISKGRFTPHAMALQTSQSLSILNRDDASHAAEIFPFANAAAAQAAASKLSGGAREFQFTLPESVPFAVRCSVHPWMSAWVLVRSDPYYAISDEHGRFEIDDLPIGEATFQFWHERAGYLSDAKIDGKNQAWPKGRATIKIAPGKNELGTIHYSADRFDAK